MKKLINTSVLTLLLLTAAAGQTGPAQQGPPPPPAPLEAEQTDPGRLEGEKYTNDFFGVSFSVPRGWYVQDSAARRATLEMGKDALTANADQRKKAQMEAVVARTNVLVSALKHSPYAVTPGFNAHFACVAERVPTAVVKTGADYIQMSLAVTRGSPIKMELMGRMRSERLGGRLFTAADVKTTLPQGVVVQKYYVMLNKGHALTFIYSYSDETDLPALKGILGSVAFKPAARPRP
jgi:hypothetical protein